MIIFLILLLINFFLFGIAWAMDTMSDVAYAVIITLLYYISMYGLTYHTIRFVRKQFEKQRLKDAERLRPSLASSDLSH